MTADPMNRNGCCAHLPKWSGVTRPPRLYANQAGHCYIVVDGVRLCLTLAVDRLGHPVVVLKDTDPRRAAARGNSRVATRCSDLHAIMLEIAGWDLTR